MKIFKLAVLFLIAINIHNETPTTNNCTQKVSGKIAAFNNSPITNGVITVYLDGVEIKTTSTNKNGEYNVTLNCNNTYSLVASAPNFLSKRVTVTTNNNANETKLQNFILKPECYQKITGVVVNDLTQEKIEDAIVTLYLDGEEIEKTKTGTNGAYNFQTICNSNYYIITSKNDFINDFYEFSTTSNANETKTYNPELEPECVQTISGTIRNKITKEPLSGELKLLLNNVVVETISINNDGKYFIQFQCTTNYRIIATKPDYKDDSYYFLTDYIENKQPDFYNLKKDLFLEPNECFQVVLGRVLDSENNPISNATVSLRYQNHEIKSFETKADGSYFFNIKCGKEYQLTASKEGLTTEIVNFKASGIKNDTQNKDIYLEELTCNQLVSGTITNTETKQPIANTHVKLFEGTQEVNSVTTDASGNYTFTINCQTDYKIVASNSEYNSNNIAFSTDKKRDASTTKNIELKELDCNQLVSGTITNAETKQPIANTHVKLFEGTQEVNSVTTDTSGNYTFTLNCQTDYKIVASNSEYNSNNIAFSTDKKRDASTTKNIELKELDCNQLVSGTITNAETKQPIANTHVKLFEGTQEVNSVTTDASGNYTFTINCQTDYKVNAINENYNTASKAITTSNKRDVINTLNFELSSKVCNQKVTGIIRDKLTKKPLPETTISLYQNNKVIATQTVGSDGVYEFDLECSSTYKLTVFKNNNLESFRLKTALQNGRTLTLHIDIDPPNCIQYINGVTIENISKEPIPNTKISLLNYSNVVKTITSDSNGSFYFEIDCNKTYTVIASKEKYTKSKVSVVSNTIAGAPHAVELVLEPIIEIKEKNGIYYIETKPIVFELDEYEVKDHVKTELNKVLFNMNQNPAIKISINFHTDSRGPDNYNLTLSQKRADAVKDYLISHGISADRISAKGFGESQLLNKCKNDVKCSEAEHAQNRRTEFIVTDK